MKINKIFFIIPLLTLGIFLLRIPKNSVTQNPIFETPTPSVIPQKVSTVIDYGDGKKTTHLREFTASQSAFTFLQNLTEELEIPLAVKQYPFGTLVESIGKYQNSKNQSWIYFVNSQSASVSADQYILQPGDLVEWKYIKPQ